MKKITALYLALLVLLLSLIWLLPPADAAVACTKGTDCYCDCVAGPADAGGVYKNAACQAKYGVGVPVDPLVHIGREVQSAGNVTYKTCEDWEAPTLTQNIGVGGGPPNYGPWYDESGALAVCARGQNSYVTAKFGGNWNGWLTDQPVAPPGVPTVGCSCTYSRCFTAAWHPSNLWQANNPGQIEGTPGGSAKVAILQNGQFGADVPALAPGPSGVTGGGNGVFDGQQSFSFRIPAGDGFSGPIGNVYFRFGATGANVRTLGITQAFAFPTNTVTSGILVQPWKPNEFGGIDGAGISNIFLSHNQFSATPGFPFFKLFFQPFGETVASCEAKNAAATVLAGQIDCDGGANFQYWPTSSGTPCPVGETCSYNFSATLGAGTWPLGTWGCAQGFYENMGLTNTRIRVWFTGPDGIRRLLVDITRDTTATIFRDGISIMARNAFPNANQGEPAGGPPLNPTTQTTFRYEDNEHIRNGMPVSCAQIGYAAAPVLTPPSAPSNLQVTTP